MKLLYVDIESTGLNAKTDGLIQISGIIEIDGEVKEEFDLKCRPFKGDIIDKKALEVNKTSIKELREWEDPGRVYLKLKSIFDKYVDKYDRLDKFYAIGQNVGFDLDFMREWFVKNNDNYFGSYVHYHKIDLIAITTALRMVGRLDGLENMKLVSLKKYFGMESKDHDAWFDIVATRDIFKKYLEALNGSPLK